MIFSDELAKTLKACKCKTIHPAFVLPKKTKQRVIVLSGIHACTDAKNFLLPRLSHYFSSILPYSLLASDMH